MKKRYADEERADEDLAQSMSQLSLDKAYECPKWLQDYAVFAGSAGELKELLRYTLVNESLHNILTALKNAFAVSELEKYFATDEDVENVDERTTFLDVFSDTYYAHKINSYVFMCPKNEYVTVQMQRCVEYLEKVCALMDMKQLFLCLEVFSKLRLEPFTNPIVLAIYKHLDLLATPEEKLRALNLPPEEAAAWQRIPDQRVATRREIFWTYAARREQEKQMDRTKHARNKEKLLAIYESRQPAIAREVEGDFETTLAHGDDDSTENNADVDSNGFGDTDDDDIDDK